MDVLHNIGALLSPEACDPGHYTVSKPASVYHRRRSVTHSPTVWVVKMKWAVDTLVDSVAGTLVDS